MTPGFLFRFVVSAADGERHVTRAGYGHSLGEQLQDASAAVVAGTPGVRVTQWTPVRAVGPRPELEALAA